MKAPGKEIRLALRRLLRARTVTLLALATLTVALLASALPALNAARTDPNVVLRS